MKRKHHQLKAWQKSLELVSQVYQATNRFPVHEAYGLTSQLRRAAVSVPSNIAEGAARTSRREFVNFLSMARGSLSEMETQLIIGRRLGYMGNEPELEAGMEEVFGLLGGLMKSLKGKET